MKTTRLFSSVAMLALGVLLWKSFVGSGDGDGCRTAGIATPPSATMTTIAAPIAVPAAIVPTASTTAPAAKAALTSSPAATRVTAAPPAPNAVADGANNALFSPAGSVLKEAAQPAAHGSVIVMKPMPQQALGEDGDLSSSIVDSRTAPPVGMQAPGSALARYKARAARRPGASATTAAKSKSTSHRQASTFEHPLGIR